MLEDHCASGGIHALHALEDLCAEFGMELDQTHLLIVEPPGLADDGLIGADLAHIVK